MHPSLALLFASLSANEKNTLHLEEFLLKLFLPWWWCDLFFLVAIPYAEFSRYWMTFAFGSVERLNLANEDAAAINFIRAFCKSVCVRMESAERER